MFADKHPASPVALRFLLHQHMYIANAAEVTIQIIMIQGGGRIPGARVGPAGIELALDELAVAFAHIPPLGLFPNPIRRGDKLKLEIISCDHPGSE